MGALQPATSLALRWWWHDDTAQDLAEYALIAALISVALIPALMAFGNPVARLWAAISLVLSNLP